MFDMQLSPTPVLKMLANEVNVCKKKKHALNTRLIEQLEIVDKEEATLASYVNARNVKSDDPEAIRKAGNYCKTQAKKVEDETEILDAISTAIRNSNEQLSRAGNSFAGNLRTCVSNAAQSAQERIRSDLHSAMEEYFACHVALKGSVMGAQYEVEQMTHDPKLGKDAGDRISTATVALREAVYKGD